MLDAKPGSLTGRQDKKDPNENRRTIMENKLQKELLKGSTPHQVSPGKQDGKIKILQQRIKTGSAHIRG